jgi:Fe-S cluster assembly ATP-binding protein
MSLVIQDLHVERDTKSIIKGVSLILQRGELVALMGPNGSGKSTLALTIMGHPDYRVVHGKILLDGKNIVDIPVNERARAGIFLSFQHPVDVPGVSLSNVLRTALNSNLPKERQLSVLEFRDLLRDKMDLLKMPYSFAERNLNEGFSGGEKKRAEILQLAILSPKIAILDETDSGLDIDALRSVASCINAIKSPHMSMLCITHYQRILSYLKPDRVLVMIDGRIVREGTLDIIRKLEDEGYDWLYGQP